MSDDDRRVALLNAVFSESPKARKAGVKAAIIDEKLKFTRFKRRPHVTIEKESEDDTIIQFQYDPYLVDAVKAIPGRYWHSQRKVWVVPTKEAAAIKKFKARAEEPTSDWKVITYKEAVSFLEPELVEKAEKAAGKPVKKEAKHVECKSSGKLDIGSKEAKKYVDCVASNIRGEIGGSVKRVYMTEDDIDPFMKEAVKDMLVYLGLGEFVQFSIVKSYGDNLKAQYFFVLDLSDKIIAGIDVLYNTPIEGYFKPGEERYSETKDLVAKYQELKNIKKKYSGKVYI